MPRFNYTICTAGVNVMVQLLVFQRQAIMSVVIQPFMNRIRSFSPLLGLLFQVAYVTK
jgi:hypothetical protein